MCNFETCLVLLTTILLDHYHIIHTFGVSAISIVGFERCYVPCVSSLLLICWDWLEIASVPSASTFVIGVIPRAKKIEKE